MGKNFCKNWESLRKITEKFHVVKSHDSHSNQMCGENKRVKRKSFRLCLVRVKVFPKNIPSSGKENVFMCLVAFQNIFRKIFSGVWKRRRKRQNPEKPEQTQKNMARSRDRRRDLTKRRSRSARMVLREIAISDHDRRRNLAKRRSRSARTVLREIMASDRDRRRDLTKYRSRRSRSRERCFARALFA